LLPNLRTRDRTGNTGYSHSNAGSGMDVPFPIMRHRTGKRHENHRRQTGTDRLMNAEVKDGTQERDDDTAPTGTGKSQNDADTEKDRDQGKQKVQESRSIRFFRVSKS
jgi:hypothetical protein